MDAVKQWNEFVGTTHEKASEAVHSAKEMADRAARTKAGKATRDVADRVERVVADRATNAMWRATWLTAAGIAAIGSVSMAAINRKHEALFIGQWVPAMLIIALWGQTIRR